MLAIMPLGYEVLPNILLAAALFYLATRWFDASLLDILRRRPRQAAAHP